MTPLPRDLCTHSPLCTYLFPCPLSPNYLLLFIQRHSSTSPCHTTHRALSLPAFYLWFWQARSAHRACFCWGVATFLAAEAVANGQSLLAQSHVCCDYLNPWELRKLHCLPAVAVHKPSWNAQQTNSRTQIQMPEYAKSTSTLGAPLRHPSLPVSSCAPQSLWRNIPWLATWSTKTLTFKI